MRRFARSVVVPAVTLGVIAALGACSSAAKSIDPRRSTMDAVAPSTACVVDRPYFEFQVEAPATFIDDSASRAAGWVPGRAMRGDTVSVQFVVDTVGRPEPGSFRVVRVQREALVDSARQALSTWRYAPARLRGCRVRQLVQTPVTRT